MRFILETYAAIVRWPVRILAVISALGVVSMMLVTCADVVMRIFGTSLRGSFDLVMMSGAVSIACALPYTTAANGHVAIEFFVHKLPRKARFAADSIAYLFSIALFVLLSWQSFRYGAQLHRSGVVTLTLQTPVFWMPHLIGVSCVFVALVLIYQLMRPEKELIKP